MAKANPGALASKVWAAIWGFLRKKWFWLVLAVCLMVVVALPLVLVWTGRLETGFGEYTLPTPETEWAKTLWDLGELCLVPLALGLGATGFAFLQNKRERELEQDRLREAALQRFLDRMTELMLEKRLQGEMPDSLVGQYARAYTLTTARQLDGVRKGLLLQFLNDWGMLGRSICAQEDGMGERMDPLIDLNKADLTEANLEYANLMGAILKGANLRKARFKRADLHATVLIHCELRDADLRLASLGHTNLSLACLDGARLDGAYLDSAILRGASLRGTILSDANLWRAKVTERQLAQAGSLEGATMPDGTKHRSKGPSESEEVPGAAGRGNDGAC
jgi:uncharacterized protein YjbI with pentapeptide repeats